MRQRSRVPVVAHSSGSLAPFARTTVPSRPIICSIIDVPVTAPSLAAGLVS